MADASVQYLMNNLMQLQFHHAELIRPIEDEVEVLLDCLSDFKSFLEQAAQIRSNDGHGNLTQLLTEIQVSVNQTEDAIDKFVVEAVTNGTPDSEFAAKVFGAAKEIEQIRKSLSINMDQHKIAANRYELAEVPRDEDNRDANENTEAFIEEDYKLGLDDNDVLKFFTEGSNSLEIFCIVGTVAIGKTSFARRIFRNPEVEYEFLSFIWITIPHPYNRREVFLDILGNFPSPNNEYQEMSDEQLTERIAENLRKEKYLFVLDNVWKKEVWDDVKVVFPSNIKGRVVITTRDEDVASHASTNNNPYRLNLLNDWGSFYLLEKKVFPNSVCPPELSSPAKRIARMCRGQPLSIVIIAGVLVAIGNNTHSWEMVCNSMEYMRPNLADVVRFNYDKLPTELKYCFLYLGIFPEDLEIPTRRLIRLWIAEGLVQQNNHLSAEEVAEKYLNDLGRRNLLIVVKRRLEDGQIKSCRVNNIIRDFCRTEAAKENLFKEIGVSSQLPHSRQEVDSSRRLCIHSSSVFDFISTEPSSEHVRSFLSLSSKEILLPPEHVYFIPDGFKLLKVLDARAIRFTHFPKDLTLLVLLKYIALSCKFKVLPESITNLWNLETLIVKTDSPTLEIRAKIWKMVQLRHVHTDTPANFTLPQEIEPRADGFKTSRNLTILSTVSPESCRKDLLSRTPYLKKLGIFGELAKPLEVESGSTLFDAISKLEYLETLKLSNDISSCPPSEATLPGLPPPYKFPRRLRKLTLTNTFLDWSNMSTLGMLEYLEVLKLKKNAFRGPFWDSESAGKFGSLAFLLIDGTDLEVWRASIVQFPLLRTLILMNCGSLEEIPSSLADVPSFMGLKLVWTTKSAARSAYMIKWKKMSELGMNEQRMSFKLSVFPPHHAMHL